MRREDTPLPLKLQVGIRGTPRCSEMPRIACLLLPLLLTATWPRSAGAVLLSAEDGTGNTTAPADDPGFANVGLRGDLSCI